MPVWQAIRPMSRSLSVHQGRGQTHAQAELGAIMEAIESDSAERFDRIEMIASWNDVPINHRIGQWADFARSRMAVPPTDVPIEWSVAYQLDGRPAVVPFASVSLDFTTARAGGIERSSSGLAAGFSRDASRVAALMELIERDAIAAWRVKDMIDRMFDVIDLKNVRYDWLQEWIEQLRKVGARLQCYHVPSLTGTPVVAAEISDLGKGGIAYQAMEGTAAHPIPEIALLRAVSEAIQCRCAYIAGARDDIDPRDFRTNADVVRVVFGLPLPPGMTPKSFARVEPGATDIEALCTVIEAEGLGPVAFVHVADHGPIQVSRAFAPGLGFYNRTRRAA